MQNKVMATDRAECGMEYDKDLHQPRYRDMLSFDTIHRRASGGIRRLPPRTVLFCWAMVGIVPWAMIAAAIYWW